MNEWDWENLPHELVARVRELTAESSGYVKIADFSQQQAYDYSEACQMVAAVVPEDRLDDVLSAPGGIGHEPDTVFWTNSVAHGGGVASVPSIGNAAVGVYESLVASWEVNGRRVIIPNSGILASDWFRLVPRPVGDNCLNWDNYEIPDYDVLKGDSVCRYASDTLDHNATCSMKREYLEEYLYQSEAVAVACFYLSCYTADKPTISLLKQEGHFETQKPGYMLDVRHAKSAGHAYCQLWGCRILTKGRQHFSKFDDKPQLEWPGIGSVKTARQVSKEGGAMYDAYIWDDILAEYEGRPGMEVNPERGYVSFGGQWSASYCSRFSRNVLRIELRKLYEGTPSPVIRAYHNYAISEAEAGSDRKQYGDRHIGQRAKEIIYSYLDLLQAMTRLSKAVGLDYSVDSIGGLSLNDIEYKGWWTFPKLSLLGRVNPVQMKREAFLDRCRDIYKLFEGLKLSPLRETLLALNVPQAKLKNKKSLSLIAFIAQISALCANRGFQLPGDRAIAISEWDDTTILSQCRPLFAVNQLRQIASHDISMDEDQFQAQLDAFGIKEGETASGYGLALDKAYDSLIQGLSTIRSDIDQTLG